MEKEIEWLLSEKYSGNKTEEFKKDVLRLKRGEPLDYVIGFTDFLGCKIDLSKKPLIPRSETEFWVQHAIEEIKNNFNKKKLIILDIFAGSGCIGISVLKSQKNVRAFFAEKEKNCLSQIKINLKINKIEPDRYKIIKSDVFSGVKGKFDFIFANPPYIAKNRKNKVQKSVLKYEPRRALFGGEDGFFYIKKFLKEVRNFLKKNGKIYIEFDSFQKKRLEKLLCEYGYRNFEFKKDQYGKWRWLLAW